MPSKPRGRGARLGLLPLLLLAAGCPKSPATLQREYAQTLRPAELQPFRLEGAPTAAVQVVRVRVWVDPDYQAQTPRWPERIAEQLRLANRVLEPQFGRRLELVEAAPWPRASRPQALEASLAELRTRDPGLNVDLVLGYVSALRLPTASTEHFGLAVLGGRHVVLRSMTLEQEYDAISQGLDRLGADEKDRLARERRVHREVTILLHEWAHTMGAIHEGLAASIMADAYHQQATGFSPESARLIEAGLQAMERPPPVGPPVDRPAPRPAPPVAPAGAPASPAPPGLAELAGREFALRSREGASRDWLQLALDADRLGAPATAERAASQSEERAAPQVARDARRLRREVALPVFGIPAPKEPEYVKLVRRVLDLVDAKQLAKAQQANESLAAAFPGSPGASLGACALAAATPQATQACEAAARAFEEAPRVQLLLGRQHGKVGQWAEARGHYRRALELDDAVTEPWSRLAQALGKLDLQDQLRELEGRYRDRFGVALRPTRD